MTNCVKQFFFILLSFWALSILVAHNGHAAPQNTLPKGFFSPPSSAPDSEEEEEELEQDTPSAIDEESLNKDGRLEDEQAPFADDADARRESEADADSEEGETSEADADSEAGEADADSEDGEADANNEASETSEAGEADADENVALPPLNSLFDESLILPTITGLLSNPTPFDENMWLSSDMENVRKLFTIWQVNIKNRPVAELARRFLLARAFPPGEMDGFEFLKLRMDKLYALGDIASLEKFFFQYPILNSRPEFARLYQQMVFVRDIQDSYGVGEACALWQLHPQSVEDRLLPLKTQQIDVLCLGLSGQTGKALTFAENLSEQGEVPREFFPLLAVAFRKDNLSDPSSAKSSYLTPSQITAPLWALYKIIEKYPTSLSIKNIEPALLSSMARDPDLVYGLRVATAQYAFLRGLLSPRFLQSFYIDISAQGDETGFYIPLRRDHQANVKALTREIRRISNVLATAPTRSAYMAVLYSWSRKIASLHTESGYRRSDGLRAALLLNEDDRLKIWLKGLNLNDEPLAMQAMQFILSGANRSAHRGIAPETIERWRENIETLVDIIAAEFFDESSFGLPDADDTDEGQAIIEAAEAQAPAQVILHILVGMDNPALNRNPSFLRAVIQGLIAIGLKREAWQIAIDGFLTEAWGA